MQFSFFAAQVSSLLIIAVHFDSLLSQGLLLCIYRVSRKSMKQSSDCFFRWRTHLYMSLFLSVCPSVRPSIHLSVIRSFCPSVRPSVVHHISGTVHHVIIIFGTHVSNDDMSWCFFRFFKF